MSEFQSEWKILLIHRHKGEHGSNKLTFNLREQVNNRLCYWTPEAYTTSNSYRGMHCAFTRYWDVCGISSREWGNTASGRGHWGGAPVLHTLHSARPHPLLGPHCRCQGRSVEPSPPQGLHLMFCWLDCQSLVSVPSVSVIRPQCSYLHIWSSVHITVIKTFIFCKKSPYFQM